MKIHEQCTYENGMPTVNHIILRHVACHILLFESESYLLYYHPQSNFSKRLRDSSSILYEDLDDKQKGSTKPSVSLLNDITVEADQEERIKSAVDSLQSGELVADGSRVSN